MVRYSVFKVINFINTESSIQLTIYLSNETAIETTRYISYDSNTFNHLFTIYIRFVNCFRFFCSFHLSFGAKKLKTKHCKFIDKNETVRDGGDVGLLRRVGIFRFLFTKIKQRILWKKMRNS